MNFSKKILIVATVFIFYSVNSFAQQNCCKEYLKEDFGAPFYAAFIDKENIMVSTYYNGFYLLGFNEIDTIQFPNNPLPDNSYNLISSFNKKIALTKNLGSTLDLYEYDQSLKTITDKNISGKIKLNLQTTDYGHCFGFAMKEKNNTLFIGTSSGILVYDTSNHLVQIQDFNGDDTIDFVYDLDFYSEETLCLCTNSGLYTLSNDNLEIKKISSQKCRQIATTGESIYFISGDPFDNNIYKFENNKTSVETTANQDFSLKFVRDMIVNYDQSLLFITHNKIFSYKDQDFNFIKDIQQGEKLYISDSKIVYLTSGILYVCEIGCLSTTNNANIAKFNFNQYPSPATEKICLNIGKDVSLHNVKITISDSSGKIVYSHEVFEHNFDINIQNLLSGTYFVTVSGNGQIIQSSFVKVTP